jgi:hypothetical protein
VVEDVEKLKPMCAVGGRVKCAATVENSMAASGKGKNRSIRQPASLLGAQTQKN